METSSTQTLEDMGLNYDWIERIKYKLAWIAYLVHAFELNHTRWPRKDTDIEAWILRMYKIKEEAHNGHHYTHEGTHAEESGPQVGEDERPVAVHSAVQRVDRG